MATKTIKAKVDLQNLFLQAAQEMKSTGVSIGFMVALNYLKEIANRAIELEDEVILEALEGMGLVKR
uniref:Uncharacterized protein n=1 Tax=viral metagenome TaxID=1070528 RepID=A0A6M3LUH4_9ZZZZ